MKQIFNSIVDVLFPKVCVGCETILSDNENLLCSYCRFELPRTNHLFEDENSAFKKFYGIVALQKVAALVYFEKKGIVQRSLHQLKYKNAQNLGVLFANMFEDDLNESGFFSHDSCIIPVPLHPKKYKERGYNQIQSFCETLATNHEIDLNTTSLIRKMYNKTQSKKNLMERNTTIENAFGVSAIIPPQKNLILVDDVLTTGSTLIQCVKALQQIPHKSISILTIAYSHS